MAGEEKQVTGRAPVCGMTMRPWESGAQVQVGVWSFALVGDGMSMTGGLRHGTTCGAELVARRGTT